MLDGFAAAARPLAEADLGYVLGAGTKDEALEGVVVGTVLGDAAMAAVRALARRELSGVRQAEETPTRPRTLTPRSNLSARVEPSRPACRTFRSRAYVQNTQFGSTSILS